MGCREGVQGWVKAVQGGMQYAWEGCMARPRGCREGTQGVLKFVQGKVGGCVKGRVRRGCRVCYRQCEGGVQGVL